MTRWLRRQRLERLLSTTWTSRRNAWAWLRKRELLLDPEISVLEHCDVKTNLLGKSKCQDKPSREIFRIHTSSGWGIHPVIEEDGSHACKKRIAPMDIFWIHTSSGWSTSRLFEMSRMRYRFVWEMCWISLEIQKQTFKTNELRELANFEAYFVTKSTTSRLACKIW